MARGIFRRARREKFNREGAKKRQDVREEKEFRSTFFFATPSRSFAPSRFISPLATDARKMSDVERFKMKRPLVLIVRDGWGKNPYPQWNHANAVHLAKHPVADRLLAQYPNVLIHTSGLDVGLPERTMGNSEVGHQNIGAGRIVDQESVRISKQIRGGEFFDNPLLNETMQNPLQKGTNLHLLGI